MFSLVYGLQIDDAYSTCGLTRELYASDLTPLLFVLIFRFANPKVLFALAVMLLM